MTKKERFVPKGWEFTAEERAKLKAALASPTLAVFSSVHLYVDGAGDLIGSCFLPVGLGGLSGVFPTEDDFRSFNPVMYEYIENAMARAVNGYPIFMSMHLIPLEMWNEIVRETMEDRGEKVPPLAENDNGQ